MRYEEQIMPRRSIGIDEAAPSNPALVNRLCAALQAPHESGQPLIYEQELGPERLRVTVIWDEWDKMAMDARTAFILKAYEAAEGIAARNRIALANGLTVPEATAVGMLPYQVTTALREGDPVTFEQCWDAMLAEGASTLFGPNVLQLRFATREEAESCRNRLVTRLPQSKNVWVISIEVSIQDHLGIHDSVSAQ
jgi:hypothetical protein